MSLWHQDNYPGPIHYPDDVHSDSEEDSTPPSVDASRFPEEVVSVSSLDVLYMWAQTNHNAHKNMTRDPLRGTQSTCYAKMMDAINAIKKGNLPS